MDIQSGKNKHFEEKRPSSKPKINKKDDQKINNKSVKISKKEQILSGLTKINPKIKKTTKKHNVKFNTVINEDDGEPINNNNNAEPDNNDVEIEKEPDISQKFEEYYNNKLQDEKDNKKIIKHLEKIRPAINKIVEKHKEKIINNDIKHLKNSKHFEIVKEFTDHINDKKKTPHIIKNVNDYLSDEDKTDNTTDKRNIKKEFKQDKQRIQNPDIIIDDKETNNKKKVPIYKQFIEENNKNNEIINNENNKNNEIINNEKDKADTLYKNLEQQNKAKKEIETHNKHENEKIKNKADYDDIDYKHKDIKTIEDRIEEEKNTLNKYP